MTSGRRPGRSIPKVMSAAVVGAALALALASCSSGGNSGSSGATPGKGSSVIDATRCANNKAAGQIVYLSNYGEQGAGSLDAVAADKLGYFNDVCLDVKIRPGKGDPVGATQLTASGAVTLTTLGSAADAITAAAHNVHILAVGTYGNTLAICLMTMADVTSLKSLEGHRVGYKGAMPPQLTAMLNAAGVDVSKVTEVGVGYDPSILPRGQVKGLAAYKSNEVIQLRNAGHKITVWDPAKFGIKGTFGAIVVNPAFAKAHPSAVEDFLRATLHGLDYCSAQPDACGAFGKEAAGPGYDAKQNGQRIQADARLAQSAEPSAKPIGYMDPAAWQGDAMTLKDANILTSMPDLTSLMQPQYMAAITGPNGHVTW